MERKMETTRMGYRGTTLRIHSFIPNLLAKSKLTLGLQKPRKSWSKEECLGFRV